MTISERILTLRRAAGISQETLAGEVGVSRQAIGKWESGASLPGLDNLQQLAHALGVSCDELLTGENPAAAPHSEASAFCAPPENSLSLEGVKALLDAQSVSQAGAARRRRILSCILAGVGCTAVLAAMLHYGGRLHDLARRLDGLDTSVNSIDSIIDSRIASIQSGIEESLRQQTSIVASFDWTYGPVDSRRNVPLTVVATPRDYVEGLAASFTLTPAAGEPILLPGAPQAGNIFSAVFTVPLDMAYSEFIISVSFIQDGVTKTEELFREYDFVQGYQSVISIMPTDFTIQNTGNGMTRLGGDLDVLIDRAWNESAGWPVSARVELLVNGETAVSLPVDISCFSPQASSDGSAGDQAEACFGMTACLTFPIEEYSSVENVQLKAFLTQSDGVTVTATQELYHGE